MEIKLINENYVFIFDEIEEENFFINALDLSLNLLKQSKLESSKVSLEIEKFVNLILRHNRHNRLLRKEFVESVESYVIRKEFLDFLFEHVQTLMMIENKGEIKEEFKNLEVFYRNFLDACKSVSNLA